MLAKMTVWARNWDSVIDRTARALDEFVIRGVKTTIPFYQRIMRDPYFRRGEFNTHYIEDRIEDLTYEEDRDPMDIVAAISAAVVAHTHR
jgi:pyruvate carboxylase subunit A